MRAADRHLVARAARVAVATALLLLAGEARADDIDAARRDFSEGVRLYQRGDYEGARRLFMKADGEHHAAPMIYNLGLAEERLRHHQAAVDAYESYIAEAGEAGEFWTAAAMAIAQIKARSTRLRIDTSPRGAHIFVDGSPLPESSPTTFLVAAGHHVIVAQGDGWRGEQTVEVQATGDATSILIEAADAAPHAPVAAPRVVAPVETPVAVTVVPSAGRDDAASQAGTPSGFVWGASFALAPYHMIGAAPGTSNDQPATQVIAGTVLEVGHAVTNRFEFLGRGLLGLGPDGKPSYAFMGGPGISLRFGSSLWLGATFLGGQIETVVNDVRYGTDLVFGAMAEGTLVVIESPEGQWTAGVQPGLLLTDKGRDNTTFFFPITLGYRAF